MGYMLALIKVDEETMDEPTQEIHEAIEGAGVEIISEWRIDEEAWPKQERLIEQAWGTARNQSDGEHWDGASNLWHCIGAAITAVEKD